MQDAVCSQECRYKNNLNIAHAANERRKVTFRNIRCVRCGKHAQRDLYVRSKYCSNDCRFKHMAERRQGRGNPAYRNGFAVAGKRTYTGIHLRACKKYREAFLEKHSYPFCEVCGVNENGTPRFEVHHIYFASLYPKHKELHNFKNLIHICIRCHNDFHGFKLPDVFKKIEAERGLKELFAA